jgi:hypothetical protein
MVEETQTQLVATRLERDQPQLGQGEVQTTSGVDSQAVTREGVLNLLHLLGLGLARGAHLRGVLQAWPHVGHPQLQASDSVDGVVAAAGWPRQVHAPHRRSARGAIEHLTTTAPKDGAGLAAEVLVAGSVVELLTTQNERVFSPVTLLLTRAHDLHIRFARVVLEPPLTE